MPKRSVVRIHPLQPHYSLIAQSVERRTVNPQVAGSNPARGAKITAHEALLAMRRICNPEIGSSILSMSTISKFNKQKNTDVGVEGNTNSQCVQSSVVWHTQGLKLLEAGYLKGTTNWNQAQYICIFL